MHSGDCVGSQSSDDTTIGPYINYSYFSTRELSLILSVLQITHTGTTMDSLILATALVPNISSRYQGRLADGNVDPAYGT